MIADEFSAELAEGVAYVSGHDEESRPVLVLQYPFIYLFFLKKKCFVLFFFSKKKKKQIFKCMCEENVVLVADFPDQARLSEVPLSETVRNRTKEKHKNSILVI